MDDMRSRIKSLREELGLSQVDFAKRLGVTSAHISQIEKGKNNLSDALLKLICKEYYVNEEWLRDGSGLCFTEEYRKMKGVFERVHILKESAETIQRLDQAQQMRLNMLCQRLTQPWISDSEIRRQYFRLCEDLLSNILVVLCAGLDFDITAGINDKNTIEEWVKNSYASLGDIVFTMRQLIEDGKKHP
jgi:transcriptional regulator with XRE-family HTH domain